MRKGKSIIGKTILALETGERLETVSDLVIDPEGRQLMALVASQGGFLSSSKVVPVGEVHSFGKDAVVVRSPDSIVSASDHPDLHALVEHDDKILAKKVFTTSGEDLGSIADIYFDEATGEVRGYELSGGLLGDAASGTSYLAVDEVTTIGRDVIYVLPHTAEVLEGQVGGIRGAAQDAGKQLGSAKDKLASAAGGGADATGDSLVGKRTGSEVEADDGSVIVPKGRRVREEDVEAARAAGKLPALTAAVGMGAAQEAGEGAKVALAGAGDSAASLWDQFTAKIGEVTDSTGKRVDEVQSKRRLGEIADAIGRPVTKVILDREDNVVLDMGDIITHAAVQRAHEAGGLDSLLGSVYKKEVELTKDELHARTAAEPTATVDKASGGAVVLEELEAKIDDAETERAEEQERKKREAEVERATRERERATRAAERETAKRG